jgi:hypothetical protein
MGKFCMLTAASLAVFSLINAVPLQMTSSAIGTSQSADLAFRAQNAGIIGNTRSIMASCKGQSCQIANLSGSTGKLPTIKPAGGTPAGYKCISKYSPETVKAAESATPGKPGPANSAFGSLALGFANVMDMLTGPHIDTGTYTCGCKKNIVIYARGTTEIGVLGEVVGEFRACLTPI